MFISVEIEIVYENMRNKLKPYKIVRNVGESSMKKNNINAKLD